MESLNLSGIENITTTDRRIGDVKIGGTNSDDSYRLIVKAVFETSVQNVFEVYQSPGEIKMGFNSVIMSREQLLDKYGTVFKTGTDYPISLP